MKKRRKKRQPKITKDQKNLGSELEQIDTAKKLSDRLKKLPTKKGKAL